MCASKIINSDAVDFSECCSEGVINCVFFLCFFGGLTISVYKLLLGQTSSVVVMDNFLKVFMKLNT